MTNISFSNRVKNELARIIPPKKCCSIAEFSALLRAGGTLQISAGQQWSFCISTENPAVARHVFRLGKGLHNWSLELMVQRQDRLHKQKRYLIRLVLLDSQDPILQKLGILKDLRVVEGIKPPLIRRQCCQRAYLRGIFLGCGSVSNPEAGYHLELVLSSAVHAQDVVELLDRVELQARINLRKNMQVVYLKEAEQIASLFRIIGAHGALLHLEDVRVLKDVRNQVNRLVNCDTANVEKIVSTGLRQVRNIKLIAERKGLDSLPPSLKEMAEIRLEHPEASLKELGDMLEPRLGKSGVNHRLRRLEEIAEQLSYQKTKSNI